MFQQKRKRKPARKKTQALDLTNAPVKRKANQASRQAIAARAGEVAQLHGVSPQVLDPPIYRVEPRGQNTEPSPNTEY